MRLSQPRILLYAGLIFASGALLGAFGFRFYRASTDETKAPVQKGPANFRARYMEESQRRLNLTEEQLTKLGQIFDQTRERMRALDLRWQPEFEALRKRMEPEQRTIREEQIDKIRAMLTPEQRLEYEKLRQERDDRAKLQSKQGRKDEGRPR
jgi:Spy/CpxP family protein refolding chaperone